MHAAVIGAVWAIIFAEIVLSPADPELASVKRSARTYVLLLHLNRLAALREPRSWFKIAF